MAESDSLENKCTDMHLQINAVLLHSHAFEDQNLMIFSVNA